MSSPALQKLNKTIGDLGDLLKAIGSTDFEENLKKLNIRWDTNEIDEDDVLVPLFRKYEFIKRADTKTKLTKSGLLFVGRVLIDFEKSFSYLKTNETRYLPISILSIGKNSATFLAKHSVFDKSVVLKLIRPGASENIRESLRIVASDETVPCLVQPIDIFKVKIPNLLGGFVDVECVVFPHVAGISLREFLNKSKTPLNSFMVATFVQQVGQVLAFLEGKGAYHGDLHEENIIVSFDASNNLKFNVIDVSFGAVGSLTAEVCKENDMKNFRQHIWNILEVQQSYLKKMSIRKYLGAATFEIIASAMEMKSFEEIVGLFHTNLKFQQYVDTKKKFLENKFSPPGDFKLQRYEEITDPQVALDLFVPFPELMESIKVFGNLVLSGNRGSGKSTYLAAMAFFPKVEAPSVDFRELFGIYFPCRQGEFRLLAPSAVSYDSIGFAGVKHVMVIKVVRKTLETLVEAIEQKKLDEPVDYAALKSHLSRYLRGESLISLDRGLVSEIKNIESIIVRIEMKELDELLEGGISRSSHRKATEVDLHDFFQVVRNSFPKLSMTRFHILFDDAGRPNIPDEVQQIINDLISSSNPIWCVKLTTEEYSYKFSTSANKELEEGHDYIGYDIQRKFLSGGKTAGMDQAKLEEHWKNILRRRLIHFKYQSTDIVDYVGDDKTMVDALVHMLATGKRNAYYCGWSMIWIIADRNPRNLLELVSEIFSVGDIKADSKPVRIPNRSQDRAIRSVSEKRWKSLSQISGEVGTGKSRSSLGRTLFDITSALGSVFRTYLRTEKPKRRKDGKWIREQTLAIERNDFGKLNSRAEMILERLITFGVLDESRLEFARDDQVKKPLYVLNRIYCPAFSIGYQRHQHLRLSAAKFEELLLDPHRFIKDGSTRLRAEKTLGQKDLFGEW